MVTVEVVSCDEMALTWIYRRHICDGQGVCSHRWWDWNSWRVKVTNWVRKRLRELVYEGRGWWTWYRGRDVSPSSGGSAKLHESDKVVTVYNINRDKRKRGGERVFWMLLKVWGPAWCGLDWIGLLSETERSIWGRGNDSLDHKCEGSGTYREYDVGR